MFTLVRTHFADHVPLETIEYRCIAFIFIRIQTNATYAAYFDFKKHQHQREVEVKHKTIEIEWMHCIYNWLRWWTATNTKWKWTSASIWRTELTCTSRECAALFPEWRRCRRIAAAMSVVCIYSTTRANRMAALPKPSFVFLSFECYCLRTSNQSEHICSNQINLRTQKEKYFCLICFFFNFPLE